MIKANKRITISLSKELANDFNEIVASPFHPGNTDCEVFRNSIVILSRITNEIAKGNKIFIADEDGEPIQELVFKTSNSQEDLELEKNQRQELEEFDNLLKIK
ncbi:hypothetical protein KAS08_00295 [Candidatus Pacearchaeota archaeon]|nr:hypothetical protein [Candidatus Pacearchaeota archaeon]